MTEPQPLSSEAAADLSQANVDMWRKEIHSRVAGFRSRKGRRIEGAFSMRFPFGPNEPVVPVPAAPPEQAECDQASAVAEADAAPQSAAVTFGATEPPEPAKESGPSLETPEVVFEPVAIAAERLHDALVPPLLEPDSEPQPVVRPRPRTKRKVIAFPRQHAAETAHRLADPVLPEQPRILDVPEELEAYPTTPFFAGLQFEPVLQTPTNSSEHIDLPFRAVSIARRIYAAVVDCSLAAAAAAVFLGIGYKMLPNLVLTKPARLTVAALPLLLWAVYQYMFTVYGGRTAGMQVAGLRISTFEGRCPSLRHRRNRALGLYLSVASLAMGLLWAFVDVDTLCWHDRISGTYLTRLD
jgi:uncharacterized RDD family membrane protein YckC